MRRVRAGEKLTELNALVATVNAGRENKVRVRVTVTVTVRARVSAGRYRERGACGQGSG